MTSSAYNTPPNITLDAGGLQFNPGVLGTAAINVNPGTGHTAALVFQGSGTVANTIDLQTGTLRLDTEGSSVTVSGTISGSGSLVTSDTRGNGTLMLDPTAQAGIRCPAGSRSSAGRCCWTVARPWVPGP